MDVKREREDQEREDCDTAEASVSVKAEHNYSVAELASPSVAGVEVMVARSRGSRGTQGSRAPEYNKGPEPHTINQLLKRDINEMPLGRPLETPLHPKRKRVQQSSFVKYANVNVKKCENLNMLCSGEERGPSSTDSRSLKQSPRIRRRQILRDKKPVIAFNNGSDPSSGESEDEDVLSQFIPRVLMSVLETPVDAEDEHFAELITEPTTETALSSSTASTLKEAPTAMHHPLSFYDFQWKAFPTAPIPLESRRESFSKSNVGPATPHVEPYDIFIAIWDRQLMEHIVSETNRYAQQVATQLFNTHKRRGVAWRDTTVDELYVYFGIILAMGVVIKSRLEEYWVATNDIFYTPGFSAHMAFNRFLLLSKCLHFNNNEDMNALELDVSEAKLFKIQPVLTHLNMKFQAMYNLEQNISIDDTLLKWRGCLDIDQIIPSVGITTYEVCESQTGYLWRFEIHAHKRSPSQQLEDPLHASIPAIVLRLLHGLENKGHTVWMDSYYNSPSLARRLKALGFDCVGTLRTNRMFVPLALRNLTEDDMRQDLLIGSTSGDVDVMIWRHRSKIAMISTYHGNAVSLDRDSIIPILIMDYNIMMGGLDRKDQMLSIYPIERKGSKIWYKKFFKRLLNVSVLNSFIIHRKSSSSSLSHRNFRISLIESLLSKHCSVPTSTPSPDLPVNDATTGR